MEMIDVVGRGAFLEALGDPGLRVWILDKVTATIDKALRIALNLEVLDKSKETQKKAMDWSLVMSRRTRSLAERRNLLVYQ